MAGYRVNKTYAEINEKIRSGDVVVATAEEIIDIVNEKGAVEAARDVDVVTTGTFSPMCSSGAFINIGQSVPTIKASRVWFNNVPAYGGLAAIDCFLGATEPCEEDPLNKVWPGEFNYGGGHVIEDLIAGRDILLQASGYGSDDYPLRKLERTFNIHDLRDAFLFNPRNCYQNYNVGVNLSDRTIYTYMGILRPDMGNVSYSSAGQLSPLLNDPYFRTIGVGTRIFLGGGVGYVAWHGTQHSFSEPRNEKGVPTGGAGTLAVVGDMKQMSAEWVKGLSLTGYGVSIMMGLGIPIPILDEEILAYTAISDTDILAPLTDYGLAYPENQPSDLGYVSYADLKSGEIEIKGKKVRTAPLSSYSKAREIALILKDRISKGRFTLGQPSQLLPSSEVVDRMI